MGWKEERGIHRWVYICKGCKYTGVVEEWGVRRSMGYIDRCGGKWGEKRSMGYIDWGRERMGYADF